MALVAHSVHRYNLLGSELTLNDSCQPAFFFHDKINSLSLNFYTKSILHEEASAMIKSKV